MRKIPRTGIYTFTGRVFDLAFPNPEAVTIFDVAHALSNICRFVGHTRVFYSVAEHALLVSEAAGPGFELRGLLHDGHEAYCGDATSPLKAVLADTWGTVERRCQAAVYERYGLAWRDQPVADLADEVVHRADRAVLHREVLELFNGPAQGEDWLSELPPPIALRRRLGLSPEQAREEFLQRFFSIMARRIRGTPQPETLAGQKQSELRHLAGAASELDAHRRLENAEIRFVETMGNITKSVTRPTMGAERPFSPPPPAPPAR